MKSGGCCRTPKFVPQSVGTCHGMSGWSIYDALNHTILGLTCHGMSLQVKDFPVLNPYNFIVWRGLGHVGGGTGYAYAKEGEVVNDRVIWTEVAEEGGQFHYRTAVIGFAVEHA